MYGAPGVGKGTYGEKLAKDLGLNYLSTGQQIRRILNGEYKSKFSQEL